jgi:hypothetical protein
VTLGRGSLTMDCKVRCECEPMLTEGHAWWEPL